MSANRHTDAQSANPTTADRVLAAARESILAVGWRRTTLTDIANRAGVSRMTVYRTCSDMESVFADLMTQEWAQVMAEAEAAVDPSSPAPARIAETVARAASGIRANEVFRRVVDIDPELLLPYLLDRPGRSQTAVLAVLEAAVAAGQAAGEVRAGDPARLARAVLLAAHAFGLSAATMATDEVSVTDLDEELVDLIRSYLA